VLEHSQPLISRSVPVPCYLDKLIVLSFVRHHEASFFFVAGLDRVCADDRL